MADDSKRFSSVWSVTNLSLVLCSILLTGIGLETYLRLAGYQPMEELLNGREAILRPSISKQRRYEATPGSSAHAWGADIKINSHGFRDREYRLTKKANVYRIVVLGDSIAFGNFLPVEQTFANRLEDMFAENKKSVEVLNLSLGGYNTLQEVSTLETLGLQFDPDLVVLAYCFNDIGDNSPNLKYIKKLEHYRFSFVYRLRLAQFIQTKLDRIALQRNFEKQNSQQGISFINQQEIADVSTDNLLTPVIGRLRTALGAGKDYHSLAELYTSQQHLGRLRFALEKLGKLKDQHGFDVIGTIIPVMDSSAKNEQIYKAANAIVEHEFARVGLSIVNMYPDFRAVPFSSLQISEADMIHPNVHGHKLIAERLFEELQSRHLD